MPRCATRRPARGGIVACGAARWERQWTAVKSLGRLPRRYRSHSPTHCCPTLCRCHRRRGHRLWLNIGHGRRLGMGRWSWRPASPPPRWLDEVPQRLPPSSRVISRPPSATTAAIAAACRWRAIWQDRPATCVVPAGVEGRAPRWDGMVDAPANSWGGGIVGGPRATQCWQRLDSLPRRVRLRGGWRWGAAPPRAPAIGIATAPCIFASNRGQGAPAAPTAVSPAVCPRHRPAVAAGGATCGARSRRDPWLSRALRLPCTIHGRRRCYEQRCRHWGRRRRGVGHD